jgi:hypothetical protein
MAEVEQRQFIRPIGTTLMTRIMTTASTIARTRRKITNNYEILGGIIKRQIESLLVKNPVIRMLWKEKSDMCLQDGYYALTVRHQGPGLYDTVVLGSDTQNSASRTVSDSP